MSKHDPTLAEFLAGYAINVYQAKTGKLVAYTYSSKTSSLIFYTMDSLVLGVSKLKYNIFQAAEVYNRITPQKRPIVCR